MVNVTLFIFKLVYKNFGKKLDFALKIAPKILEPKKFWIPQQKHSSHTGAFFILLVALEWWKIVERSIIIKKYYNKEVL